MVFKLGKIRIDIKNIIMFLLPTLVITSQWISFAGINLSWLLYILLCVFVLKRLYAWSRHSECCVILGGIIIYPLITGTLFNTFNLMLYFSIIMGAVYMLSIISMTNEENEVFVKGCLFSCYLFAGVGIFEIYTGIYIIDNNSPFQFLLSTGGLHYPKAFFTNTNDIAQYLAIVFPLSSTMLFSKKNKVMSILGIIGCIIVIFFASSRMAMIAFVCTFCLAYILLLLIQNKINSVLKIVVGFTAIAVALFIYNSKTQMIENIIENFFMINTSADYVSARGEIYINLIKAAIANPVGAFGQSYIVNDTPPHNLWLFMLSDFGWLITILLLLLIIKIICFFWGNFKKTNDIQYGLYVATICLFSITACISSTNEQRKVIWLFLGIIIREYLLYKKQKIKR